MPCPKRTMVGCPKSAMIEVGTNHRLADSRLLDAMLRTSGRSVLETRNLSFPEGLEGLLVFSCPDVWPQRTTRLAFCV